MEKIKNIRNVSLIFFIITGVLHFGSSILIANGLFLKTTSILNKTMDIPFVMTGLIYAFSSVRLKLTDPDQSHKTLDIILICVMIIILIALIFVNLFVPDLNV